MSFENRKSFYKLIEEQRDTKVLSLISSNRIGLQTQIAADCIDILQRY